MKRITINQTPSLPGGEPSRYVTEKFFLRSGDDYNCPPLVAGEVVELSDEEADNLLKVSKGFIIETSKKATRSLIDLAAYQPEHPAPATALATAPAPPEAPQNELVELVAKLSQQMQTQTDELAAQAKELRANAQAQAALEAKLEAALQDVSEDAPAPEEEPATAPQEIPSVVLPVPQPESVKPTKRTRRAKE